MAPMLARTRNPRRGSPTRSAWRGPSSRPSETRWPFGGRPTACARSPTAHSRHHLLGTRQHFPTSRGPTTIGSPGRSSSGVCPARAAAVRSSATRRANARASRGLHIGIAWRLSRRGSGRDTQITARGGLSGEVHPIVGGAVPHIRCRPSRSGTSTRSRIHRSRKPPPRRSELDSAAPATSPSTQITSAS